MKKIITLLLTLAFLCSLGAVTAEEEQRTLTVLCPVSALVENYDTNDFIVWLEEQTNIDVEWIQVPSTSWEDKISAIIMSGDLPDVISYGGKYSGVRTTLQQYANEEIIIPLDDLIEKYGVHTKQMFEEQPGLDTMIALEDGHIYSLCSYSDIIHCNWSSRMVINDEFLKALDMEKPTTLDEFYDYLVGVRDNDVNGNGDPNDEVPYVALNNWGGDPYTFLMNSFIFYDGRNITKLDIDEDGNIYSVLDQDAFREGLAFMNKLYDEGLIYEGSLSMDATTTRALGESGEGYAIIGCVTGTGIYAGVQGGTIYPQYSGLAPLEGYTGLRQTPYYRYVNAREGAWMITTACENPELAFELGDFLLSYDSTMRLRKGAYGKCWTDAEEGQLTIDGRQATFVELIPYSSEVQNSHLDNDLMFYETRNVFLDDRAFEQGSDLWSAENLQFWLSETTKEYYMPYGKEVLPSVAIPSALVDEYSVISTDLKTYYTEWMAAFLNGEADIEDDAVWEEYKQGLYDMGLERFVEIYLEAYEASPLKWGA